MFFMPSASSNEDLIYLLDTFLSNLIYYKANAARYNFNLTHFGFSNFKVSRGIGDRCDELEYLDSQVEQIISEEKNKFIVIFARENRVIRFVPDRYYPSVICVVRIDYSQNILGYIWFTFDAISDFDSNTKEKITNLFFELESKIPWALDIAISNFRGHAFKEIFNSIQSPLIFANKDSLILINKAAKNLIQKANGREQLILDILSKYKYKSNSKQIIFDDIVYEIDLLPFYNPLFGELNICIFKEITDKARQKNKFRDLVFAFSSAITKNIDYSIEKLNLLTLLGNYSKNQKAIVDDVTKILIKAQNFLRNSRNVYLVEKKEMAFEPTNVIVMMETVKSSLMDLAAQRQVEFKQLAIGDFPIINLSKEFMELGLFNILEFLLKTSQQKSYIEIKFTASDTNMTIFIKNFGTGLNLIDNEHIWDEYYEFTTDLTGGVENNLSLIIAKNIISNHNGVIKLESQPGRGISITVTLPVV